MVPEMVHRDGAVGLGLMDNRSLVSDFMNRNGRSHNFTFDD